MAFLGKPVQHDNQLVPPPNSKNSEHLLKMRVPTSDFALPNSEQVIGSEVSISSACPACEATNDFFSMPLIEVVSSKILSQPQEVWLTASALAELFKSTKEWGPQLDLHLDRAKARMVHTPTFLTSHKWLSWGSRWSPPSKHWLRALERLTLSKEAPNSLHTLCSYLKAYYLQAKPGGFRRNPLDWKWYKTFQTLNTLCIIPCIPPSWGEAKESFASVGFLKSLLITINNLEIQTGLVQIHLGTPWVGCGPYLPAFFQ